MEFTCQINNTIGSYGHQKVPASLRNYSGAKQVLSLQTLKRQIKFHSSVLKATAEVGERNLQVENHLPTITLDNKSDPLATIIKISYANKLSDLQDTVAALRRLGLFITKAKITSSDINHLEKTFYVTDNKTGDKISNSDRLEDINYTILENMKFFNPESKQHLAYYAQNQFKNKMDLVSPLGERKRILDTSINISSVGHGPWSQVTIMAEDRAGLLLDIVKVLKSHSISVQSASIQTKGKHAYDLFYVNFHGEPLNEGMTVNITKSLEYFLSHQEIKGIHSY